MNIIELFIYPYFSYLLYIRAPSVIISLLVQKGKLGVAYFTGNYFRRADREGGPLSVRYYRDKVRKIELNEMVLI
jgi:hypothetical protein